MTASQPAKNRLADWYQTALGLHFKEQIQQHVLSQIKQQPRQTILELGPIDVFDGIAIQPTSHKIQLLREYSSNTILNASVFSEFACMPLPEASVEIVLMPHVLELDSDYKTLLNESWRVLSSNGYLVIVGINPWSLWSLQRFIQPQASLIPTAFQLHSSQKIRYHLHELDAEIIFSKTLNYLGPSSQANTTWLGNFAQLLFPAAGSLYLIIAKKSIIPATLIKLRWHWGDLAPQGISETTVGNVRRG